MCGGCGVVWIYFLLNFRKAAKQAVKKMSKKNKA
jgi:hypothetical protein